MKKLFLAIPVICLLSLNAKATNIAIIDAEKTLKESLAMKDIQSKIIKKQDEYQKEINKKQLELEAEQKSIKNKESILSEEKLQEETKKFEKKVEIFKIFADKKQNSLNKASLDAIGKINDQVKKVVKDISEEKQIDVVIGSSQVVFSNKNVLDISSDVVARLNKTITKVDIKFTE